MVQEQVSVPPPLGGWGREALAGGVCPADRTWRSCCHAPLAPAGRLALAPPGRERVMATSRYLAWRLSSGLVGFLWVRCRFASAAGMAQGVLGLLWALCPTAQFQFVLLGMGHLKVESAHFWVVKSLWLTSV